MTTEPIRSKNDIKEIKKYFWGNNKIRDYTLFVIGINTALRISDLLSLKWNDIFCYTDNSVRKFKTHIQIMEKKTGKINSFKLNSNSQNALLTLYKGQQMSEFIFASQKNKNKAISRVRAFQIIKTMAQNLSIDGTISCHSLRKTFGYHAWKMGVHPVILMSIYNHSSFEITKRYLCISQDDKDSVYDNMNL